ncbi:hypothetical protein OC861_004706 [Tilletia horrida]|nr:hypothetical protein OC845_004619 [Tilletia horrida]KAK0563641.1 hypothetical protein OC861_004706 [Tilletia horrida]
MARGSAIDPTRYADFGLTHVRYDADDPLAQLLALITLSPIFLLCAYTTIILYRRELTFINALLGQLGCEAVNWGLKRLIRQPRPHDHIGDGYGFPSSHSQFVGFFAAFFVCHFVLHHPPPRKPRTLINTMRRIEHAIAIALIVVLSALVCYSRYYLMYHSVAQIVAGSIIGVALGLSYYYVTEHLTRLPLRLPAPLASPTTSKIGSPVSSPRLRSDVATFTAGETNGSAPSTTAALSGSTKSNMRPRANDRKPPSTPPSAASTKGRRRSSFSDLVTLHPSLPLRQILLDHPVAIAFRIRDSWTVWADGGIETDYSNWRREWERRRPATSPAA